MLPSTVILDYVYSVATYTSWHSSCEDVLIIMNGYHKKHYAWILPLPHSPPDDLTNMDYNPAECKQ